MSFADDAKNIADETKKKKETERKQDEIKRLKTISKQCLSIITILKKDILQDARGQSLYGEPVGYLEYGLKDEHGRLELFLSWDIDNILETPGYKQLATYCKELEVKLEIEKRRFEDDEDDDIPVSLYHLYLKVKGWQK